MWVPRSEGAHLHRRHRECPQHEDRLIDVIHLRLSWIEERCGLRHDPRGSRNAAGCGTTLLDRRSALPAARPCGSARLACLAGAVRRNRRAIATAAFAVALRSVLRQIDHDALAARILAD